MRYRVGAAGANFEIAIRDRRLLALLSDVVQSLPEADWRDLCKALVLITDDEAHRTRRAWSATTPAGHGRFTIWLSAELGSRGANFIRSAIAHELAHAATWSAADNDYAAEAKADLWAAERGYPSRGLELLIAEGETHG